MTIAVFSTTFNIKDLFNDPQVKKALREREERYNENMRWLDEDCARKAEESMAREWNKHSVCDEEWRKRGLRDLTLLDGELWNGSTRSRIARDRWTFAITSVMEESITSEVEAGGGVEIKRVMKPSPKIWHCGHGTGRDKNPHPHFLEKHLKAADDGVLNNTCSIFHGEWQLENPRGFNTHRQWLHFLKNVEIGDIIFLHCSKKGGLLCWGEYLGVEDIPYICPVSNKHEIQSLIKVVKWNPLSEPRKGVGRNCTLYEVTEDSENYENYMIFT